MPRNVSVRKPPAAPRLIPFSKDAAYAIQALARGEATPEQQKFALKWLTEDACQTYDEPFTPDNARVTDYRLGRRAVGLAIVKHINISLSKLAELSSNGD